MFLVFISVTQVQYSVFYHFMNMLHISCMSFFSPHFMWTHCNSFIVLVWRTQYTSYTQRHRDKWNHKPKQTHRETCWMRINLCCFITDKVAHKHAHTLAQTHTNHAGFIDFLILSSHTSPLSLLCLHVHFSHRRQHTECHGPKGIQTPWILKQCLK